jgi:hypothetical protein
VPDPILTDIYRAQFVMPGKSGLPTDVFVNTWYFRNDNLPAVTPLAVATQIQGVLDAFYDGLDPIGNRVSTYLSPVIDRAGCRVEVYDLGQTPPRTKYTVASPLLGAVTGALPLPNEVAAVLSFHGAVNTRRQRGRVYVGPLGNSAMAGYTAPDNDARILPQLTAAMRDRALNVRDTTQNVQWVVRSEGGTKPPLDPAGTFEVVAGWTDNAFDTQRRRGFKATARNVWPA